MNRRHFFTASAAAVAAPATEPDARATYPGLEGMQRALWRALAACEDFARKHDDCDERPVEGGTAWIAQDLCALPYLLRLLAGVLGNFSAARRPRPAALPPARLCGRNDPRHVAAVLGLREARRSGLAVLRA